eukprot:5613977-Pyramimonas_sp.AAC.1
MAPASFEEAGLSAREHEVAQSIAEAFGAHLGPANFRAALSSARMREVRGGVGLPCGVESYLVGPGESSRAPR